MAAKKVAKGALGTDPKKKTQTSRNPLIAPGNLHGDARKKWQADHGVGAGGVPLQQAPAPQGPTGPTMDTVENTANQGMQTYMDQMQQQGAFNPGDFSAMQQQAQDSVMNNFNRQMQPQFDKQLSDFRQRMAEQGVMPGTEGYNQQEQQLMQSQNNARQSAVDQSFATGLGAQNQAFGQAATQYQMPAQMLGAYAPFYAGQAQQGLQTNQQGFLGNQAELDRQFQQDQAQRNFGYQQSLQQSAPRGGGSSGLSYDQQLGIVDRNFYNNMIMQGLQNTGRTQGSTGNGFANGVATGTGAMIGSMMR